MFSYKNQTASEGDTQVTKKLKTNINVDENYKSISKNQSSEIIPNNMFNEPQYKKIIFSKKMDFQKYLGTKDVIVDIDEIDITKIVVKTRFSNTFVIEIPLFD